MLNKEELMKGFVQIIALMGIGLLLSACGSAAPAPTATLAPSHTPAPTATPENTATPTALPIPGISEPIVVNDVSVRVLAAAWEDPNVVIGASVEPGYRSLKVSLELSSAEGTDADLLTKVSFREIAVLDAENNAYQSGFFNLVFSDLSASEVTEIEMFFGILESATPVSIQFADGQTVELATLLEE
jgi:hypothetical protein